MKLRQFVKNTIRRFDQYSSYPLFYSWLMTRNEKAVFDEKIRSSKIYLEFGLGGSTLRALQKSRTRVYTIESGREWIAWMRGYAIIRHFENKRLFIHPVDIGPTIEWGFPKSEDSRGLFPAYSSDIFKVIDGRTIDLALVDGRFRVACVLKIILECHENKNLEILIHDFWDRKKYHSVLKYLDTVSRIDSMGVFTIKKDVDLESAQKDYEIYQFDPE